MGLETVLYMKGGNDETSYAKNSQLQRMLITLMNPIKEEAMRKLCKSMRPEEKGRRCVVAMADLGCSTGPNALLASHGLVSVFNRVRQEYDHLCDWLPEVQVFLNDLPGNDFNSVFRALPEFQEKLKEELGSGFGGCFVNGVSGSFYTRLFPSRTLHFVHSTSSLHWLSQVPKGVERRKGMTEASVGEAYHEQFKIDFTTFLECRSQEIVGGGCMVLTMVGRRNQTPRSLDCFSHHAYLPKVLLQMTSEGLIEEEKMDTFNLPIYAPSIGEIEDEVEKEGSFVIDQYKLFGGDEKAEKDDDAAAKELEILGAVRGVRSIFESYILSHFGQGISMNEVFRRYEGMVRDHMAIKRTRHVIVTVSLTKSTKNDVNEQ
ncbi:hypothetical protein V2J09_001834 [Rumex salicifolius]